MCNALPVTFILMPIAAGLSILLILLLFLSKPRMWTKELIAACMVVIASAVTSMAVHLFLTMFTPIQAYGLFALIVATPFAIAGVRIFVYRKKRIKEK